MAERPAGLDPRAEPAQTSARPVAQQVAAAITGAAEGRVEIRLDPEELGRVALQLQTDGDKVSLVITAERAETSELLRRHLHELAQEFRAMGYRSVDLGFGGQGGAQGRDGGAPGVRADAGTEPPPQGTEAETLVGPAPSPGPSGAGLDLRM
ncbi:flagellar hook-length control protein FliK [Limimaricola litoreus]|uniref:Flagellar hook-length control protein FliK n=1 Tax=Limimaricola litoreus TaxID=2955316 RepID=A0A9X2FVI7_9RHOB|nr:flagellar hook-length control protein FliK [Limimaricola litoreus]MCP1167928.1 flagellar hook-length control protein FliK [Limimaricola litoreus]